MSSLQEESVRNNMPVTVLGTSIDFQLLQERLAEPEREVQRLKEPLAKWAAAKVEEAKQLEASIRQAVMVEVQAMLA